MWNSNFPRLMNQNSKQHEAFLRSLPTALVAERLAAAYLPSFVMMSDF